MATTVKLARALWIVPIALLTAAVRKNQAEIKYPYFILFFIMTTVINTYLPSGQPVYSLLTNLSKSGLIITLFLIGSNISKDTLKTVGARPFLQGTILSIVVSALSLWLVYSNSIGL